jgi:hypothetical protein
MTANYAHDVKRQNCRNDGERPVTSRTDGVVSYDGSHIVGVVSEKIMRSVDSTQGHPKTIEEIRRFCVST